jgi:hypothetical protein
MGQIAKRIEDKRLLKLIRALLNAGVMENGLVSPSVEGTKRSAQAEQKISQQPTAVWGIPKATAPVVPLLSSFL